MPLGRFDLSGRTALVTGASQGLGLAMGRALASASAHVVLSSRNQTGLTREAEAIRESGGKASILVMDVQDRSAIRNAPDRLDREVGGIDILIHSAGIIDRSSFEQSTEDGWDDVIATNLTSSYLLAKAFSPRMASRRWGRIINVGSVLSVMSKPNSVAYTASKHGLAGLTKSLAIELGPLGILVNAICPGYIRTEINTALQSNTAVSGTVEKRTPLGRWGKAEELGGAAIFLASDASAFITGHLLMIDGGLAVNS